MSFLTWVGGKKEIRQKILEKLQVTGVDTYYEPFLGSGIVLITLLENKVFKEYHCSDINPGLINCHVQIQKNVDAVISELYALHKRLTKEEYWEARKLYNKLCNDNIYDETTAALFIYLNKTGYRGLYQTNLKGELNTPYGYIRKPTVLDEVRLRYIHDLYNSANVTFEVKSFNEVNYNFIEKTSAIYLDPPYKNSQMRYDKQRFDRDEYEAFVKYMNDFSLLVLSDSSDYTPPEGFYCQEIQLPNRVRSGIARRTELLCTNF